MKDIGSGQLVDDLAPLGPRHISLDQGPCYRRRRPALVPECDGQVGLLAEVADKGAGRLHARAFGSVHVERQADDDAGDSVAGNQRQQTLGVGGELGSADGLDRRGAVAHAVGYRDTDGLGAEIKAHQLARDGQDGERIGFRRFGHRAVFIWHEAVWRILADQGNQIPTKRAMKLTWFAKSCFRLHVGGRIIVTDPHDVPPSIAQHELLSGADDVIDLRINDLSAFDASNWARRPRLRLIDAPRRSPRPSMASPKVDCSSARRMTRRFSSRR